jgi:hypothetical protein
LTKTYADNLVPAVQEAIADLWEATDSPTEMLLVSTSEASSRSTTLFLRVPDALIRRFLGFSKIPIECLPKTATLLLGNAQEFSKLFEHESDRPISRLGNACGGWK